MGETKAMPKYATELAAKILMLTLADVDYSEVVPPFMQQLS